MICNSDNAHDRAASAHQKRTDAQDKVRELEERLINEPEFAPYAPDNLLEAVGEFTLDHWWRIGQYLKDAQRHSSDSAKEQMALSQIGRMIRFYTENHQDKRIAEAIVKITRGNDD